MSTPPCGERPSAAELDTHTTLVVSGGFNLALAFNRGVRSLVNKNGATQFVPSCFSYPCTVLLP